MGEENKAVNIATDRVAEMTCGKCGCIIDVADLEPFIRIECPECGKEAAVPARLDQFLLVDLLGTGGMGAVFYARDETLGRFVAIKVMLKSIGEDEEFVSTFKREAQAVAKLNHPNIAQVYSFGQAKGQPYIVMELVSGKRFDKMVAGDEPMNQAFVMWIGLEIARGLRAADDAGVIHGDIKPENILLDENLGAKLVDFGLASFAQQGRAGAIWGTPYYIAPEKVRRRKVDARSDIYSLGATLYHALAGCPPFEGETPVEVVRARLQNDPKELHEVREDIDPNVERVISRMLENMPAKRYPNYASLISDMSKVAQGLGEDPRKSMIEDAKTKKVVLAKPGDRPATVVMTRKDPPVAGDVLDEYKKLTAETSKDSVKKDKSIRNVLLAMLVISLVLSGVGTGIYIKKKKNDRIRAAEEALALEQQVGLAKETYASIQIVAANVTAMADAVKKNIEKIKNIPSNLTENPAIESEIEGLTQKMIAYGMKVSEHVKITGMIKFSAQATKNEADAATGFSTTSEKVKNLTDELASLQKIEKKIKAVLRKSETSLEEAEILKADAEKEWKADRKREEDQARKKAEEEAQKRRGEEHKVLTAKELKSAKTARNNSRSLIKRHEYRKALNDLTAQLAGYKTDKGRNAVKILMDRCSRLHGLKLFIIEKLNARPFKRGWGYSHAAGEDVLSADESGVKLRGSAMPWDQVSTAQMLRFIKYCLASPKVANRELAEQHLAAAIFCFENGGDPAATVHSGKANTAAVNYSRRAVELRPDLDEEVKRLLPFESNE